MDLALPWLDITVAAASASVRDQLARATAKFARATTAPNDHVDLVAECREPDDPSAIRRLAQTANLHYQFVWGHAGTTCSIFGTPDGSVAVVDHDAGRLELHLNVNVFDAPYSTWSDLVAAPLAEHWRARGCYPIHAGAVALGADRILLCGASGSGKTTTALALVAAGGVWQADDKILLRSRASTVEAVSLYHNTNLPPATVAHHAALAFTLARAPLDETNDKRPCDLVELGLALDLAPFVPTALLFPRRGDGAVSVLRPLREDEAVVRLSAQSPASPCRDRLRRQHDVIVSLARLAPAWEVDCGRDVLLSPARLVARVDDALGERHARKAR